MTDLNAQALEWCNRQTGSFHKGLYGIPQETHFHACAENLLRIQDTPEIRRYLCPLRKISFDDFVNYEGRRCGDPYHYVGRLARVDKKREGVDFPLFIQIKAQITYTCTPPTYP